MVETALRSAEAKPLTEKLPPGSRGVVTTSRRLAHSCAPAGVESVVNATSCSVARTWAWLPVVSKLNAEARPASRASVLQHRDQTRGLLVRSRARGPVDCRVTRADRKPGTPPESS